MSILCKNHNENISCCLLCWICSILMWNQYFRPRAQAQLWEHLSELHSLWLPLAQHIWLGHLLFLAFGTRCSTLLATLVFRFVFQFKWEKPVCVFLVYVKENGSRCCRILGERGAEDFCCWARRFEFSNMSCRCCDWLVWRVIRDDGPSVRAHVTHIWLLFDIWKIFYRFPKPPMSLWVLCHNAVYCENFISILISYDNSVSNLYMFTLYNHKWLELHCCKRMKHKTSTYKDWRRNLRMKLLAFTLHLHLHATQNIQVTIANPWQQIYKHLFM